VTKIAASLRFSAAAECYSGFSGGVSPAGSGTRSTFSTTLAEAVLDAGEIGVRHLPRTQQLGAEIIDLSFIVLHCRRPRARSDRIADRGL
jgi:hypothetical protein